MLDQWHEHRTQNQFKKFLLHQLAEASYAANDTCGEERLPNNHSHPLAKCEVLISEQGCQELLFQVCIKGRTQAPSTV